MANPLLDAMNDIDDGGSSGSVGYFCRARIEFGFKVFASNVSPEASLFTFDPFNKKTVELSLERAKAFCAEHNVTTSPAKSIALTLERATVKGRTVSWAQDIQKVVARWMPAYEKVWLPTLEKLNLSKPGSYWMHVILVNDPSGKTEKMTGQDGKERDVPQKVWVPEVIYPNEALCQKAAESVIQPGATDTSAEATPPGFTAEIWKQYKPDIMKELGGKSPAELASVSKNWNIPEEFLKTL